MTFFVFGLTGGLASGKSTVGRIFEGEGIPIIDADRLAREVAAKGSEGLAALAEAFGGDILTADGTLDRAKLSSIVFSDVAKRNTLNHIMHPRIAALSFSRANELANAGHPFACYEAALLIENGLAEALRPLVVVAAPPEVQIARAKARDGMTEEEARARIASQLPLSEKVKLADYVIDNAGDPEALRERALLVLASIREKATSKA